MNNHQIIYLDYAINPEPRYGFGKPPHPELMAIITRNCAVYEENLKHFLSYQRFYRTIAKSVDPAATTPGWINGWLPGLDSLAIYGFLVKHNPERYFEIGSGNSTKFARQAISDHRLRTKITSFDPHPRAEVDSLCDQIIRQPVENADISIFSELTAGDILFVDHSHRSFMNSDATVVFLEILPRLKPGVLVEFHDILLPFDYPPEWQQRYYNEQYLLACYLLAEGNKFDIILPNFFISRHHQLNKVLSPLWEKPELAGVETHGSSFWIMTK
ncbi:class I SAM-dependent methyltransferase [Desulforamulus aeronauticus]|uniref:Methyltransferase domain-containing protein n=1 Tax=Desulforamulus aeronauticus DSM 10349 TaxID=1121421 RepID=A0A1M6TPM5_9FIRM|nr:class I SAM-dependent methyltransferase [Desulforamulus aeronauticus]SHK58870.1 Methyltransferase domain-containing protein [Desulforamulus aeronauticus DSM 10349]